MDLLLLFQYRLYADSVFYLYQLLTTNQAYLSCQELYQQVNHDSKLLLYNSPTHGALNHWEQPVDAKYPDEGNDHPDSDDCGVDAVEVEL